MKSCRKERKKGEENMKKVFVIKTDDKNWKNEAECQEIFSAFLETCFQKGSLIIHFVRSAGRGEKLLI